MRIRLILAACSIATSAQAFDQVFNQLRIDGSARLVIPGGPTLGLWQNGKFTSTPDALMTSGQITGASVAASGSITAPVAVIGGFTITGVGTTAGTVADGLALANEASRAKAAELVNANAITTNGTAISSEAARAQAAEAALLPLSGGTLTGSLAGTAASFTGALTAGSLTGDGTTISRTAPGASVARTVAAAAGDVCNVADLGLTGAFSPACANKEIVIPPGTWSFSTTLTIPPGASVRWLGRNAVLAYTGTGDALFISGSKNIDLHGMTVDLTGAGASAKALHVTGSWFLNIYGPRIVTGGASQEAISIETSPAGTTAYGAYLINIYNPDCHGTGRYCIHLFQTAGDTGYQVTHFNLYGGWSKGQTYGLWADNLSTALISGLVVDTGTDGIFLQNSNNVTLMPGELGPNTGYGINYGTGNSAIREVFRSQASPGGSAGYRNTATYTPQILDQGQMRLYGSNADQSYWAEFKSIFSYAKSFSLTVRGGDASSPELMSYGSAQGLWLGQGNVPMRLGTAAATTTSTFGLPYVSAIAGTPTAAPAVYPGQAPIAVDSTNGKICAYIASAWKCATLQ